MSLHTSVISIEGEHASQIPAIFRRLKYRIEPESRIVSTAKEAVKELDQRPADHVKVKKVVYEDVGWTHIVDDELVMINEDEVWKEFSAQYQTRVVAWLAEGTSGTYALSLFDRGKLVRSVFATNGEISTDIGVPLPEEEGLDWAEVCEVDVTRIAESLGAVYDFFEHDLEYHVYLLDESAML